MPPLAQSSTPAASSRLVPQPQRVTRRGSSLRGGLGYKCAVGKQALVAQRCAVAGEHSAAHSAALEQRRVSTLHRLPGAKQLAPRDQACFLVSYRPLACADRVLPEDDGIQINKVSL